MMPLSKGVRTALLALSLAVVAPSGALAQPAAAKAHLTAGDKATRAKDWPAAITAYTAARDADPSVAALDGLANALYEKGEAARAYDAYEALVRAHVTKLPKDKRARAEARLKELGLKTGSLVVKGDADAEVAIDGVAAGKLPLARPVRLDVGEHKVRVTKAGAPPFEATVRVAANATETVEAKTAPQAQKGKLRVREAEGKAVRVFVDGVDVGAAPWEGEVDPGPHEVVVRGAQLASPVEKVTVAKEGVKDVELRASSSSARLKVNVDGSPTAKILLDGVEVGVGTYSGELPAGAHKLVVVREGYQRFEEELSLAEKESASRTVVLTLSDVVKTGGDDKATRKLEGFYGGFGLMGVMLPGGNGSDPQQTCKNRPQGVTDCSGGGAGLGGGLFFFGGHHWDPVGLELMLGGSYDRQATDITYASSNLGVGGGLGPDPARTESFQIHRAGGFALARTRLSFQASAVRGSFAAGVGASYRVSFLARDTAAGPLRDVFTSDAIGSVSPVLNLDASIQPRLGQWLSLPIGLMMLAESPNAKIFGDQVPKSSPDGGRALAPGVGLSTPSYQLASGPQVYLGLYVGLMFGP